MIRLKKAVVFQYHPRTSFVYALGHAKKMTMALLELRKMALSFKLHSEERALRRSNQKHRSSANLAEYDGRMAPKLRICLRNETGELSRRCLMGLVVALRVRRMRTREW